MGILDALSANNSNPTPDQIKNYYALSSALSTQPISAANPGGNVAAVLNALAGGMYANRAANAERQLNQNRADVTLPGSLNTIQPSNQQAPQPVAAQQPSLIPDVSQQPDSSNTPPTPSATTPDGQDLMSVFGGKIDEINKAQFVAKFGRAPNPNELAAMRDHAMAAPQAAASTTAPTPSSAPVAPQAVAQPAAAPAAPQATMQPTAPPNGFTGPIPPQAQTSWTPETLHAYLASPAITNEEKAKTITELQDRTKRQAVNYGTGTVIDSAQPGSGQAFVPNAPIVNSQSISTPGGPTISTPTVMNPTPTGGYDTSNSGIPAALNTVANNQGTMNTIANNQGSNTTDKTLVEQNYAQLPKAQEDLNNINSLIETMKTDQYKNSAKGATSQHVAELAKTFNNVGSIVGLKVNEDKVTLNDFMNSMKSQAIKNEAPGQHTVSSAIDAAAAATPNFSMSNGGAAMIADYTKQLAERKLQISQLAASPEIRSNPAGYQLAVQKIISQPIIPKINGVPVTEISHEQHRGASPTAYNHTYNGKNYNISPVTGQ